MLVRLHTTQPVSLSHVAVTLEVNISKGIRLHLLGNTHSSLRESKQRVYTVLKRNKWHWPGQRTTLNFLPLDFQKIGGHYDLPMALGILCASQQLPVHRLGQYIILGQLELDGSISPSQDMYNALVLAKQTNKKGVVTNFSRATYHHLRRLFPEMELCQVSTLYEATAFFANGTLPSIIPPLAVNSEDKTLIKDSCFSDVAGQQPLKKALEIAAAGGHHLMMIGPPGVGKTMLASRLGSILPPINPFQTHPIRAMFSSNEGHECIAALSGIRRVELIDRNLTKRELFGSMSNEHIKAWLMEEDDHRKSEYPTGELSKEVGVFYRSSGGVLFLDEFSSYPIKVVDQLLQQMDHHLVQVILAMNPCPCGNFNHPQKACRCSASALNNYQKKLTAACKDRLDMTIYTQYELWTDELQEASSEIKSRVKKAWKSQMERQGRQNAQLSTAALEGVCRMKKSSWRYFHQECAGQKLSIRAQQSLLALSRTLADLKGDKSVNNSHIKSALGLRLNDRSSMSPLEEARETNSEQRIKVNLGGGIELNA